MLFWGFRYAACGVRRACGESDAKVQDAVAAVDADPGELSRLKPNDLVWWAFITVTKIALNVREVTLRQNGKALLAPWRMEV